ncbi:MAG TPA: alpha/beta hydrolase [Caulobacteraceae bacterium]|jgi:pimeloyl-ACP methyl ester carboxylesterase
MPFAPLPTARIFYADIGAGPAILTTHGMAENHLYWALPGVADALVAAGYRVVSMDMRGHGRTRIEGEPAGYDVETVASDIGALADHLGLERFHLLTHATGGMAGLRYAMGNHPRVLSLMSTNTGSATAPTDGAADAADPKARFDVFLGEVRNLAPLFRGKTWVQIIEGARLGARQDVFLNSLHLAVDPKAAFGWYEACSRLGDPDTLADFMSVFYADPNPYIERLRQIGCPCLVLVGENDRMFVKPSEQLAREIPGARHVVLKGRGHMLAFEDPQAVTRELLGFLASLP